MSTKTTTKPGETITSAEAARELPAGTVVSNEMGRLLAKTADGEWQWIGEKGPSHINDHLLGRAGFTLFACANGQTVQHGLSVGDSVDRDDLRALPVGAVVVGDCGSQFERSASGQWHNVETQKGVRLGKLKRLAGVRVDKLPA